MGVVFGLLVFFTLYVMFFAKWLANWGESLIIQNDLTGLAAFLSANMNLWVIIGVILGTISMLYFGGRN